MPITPAQQQIVKFTQSCKFFLDSLIVLRLSSIDTPYRGQKYDIAFSAMKYIVEKRIKPFIENIKIAYKNFLQIHKGHKKDLIKDFNAAIYNPSKLNTKNSKFLAAINAVKLFLENFARIKEFSADDLSEILKADDINSSFWNDIISHFAKSICLEDISEEDILLSYKSQNRQRILKEFKETKSPDYDFTLDLRRAAKDTQGFYFKQSVGTILSALDKDQKQFETEITKLKPVALINYKISLSSVVATFGAFLWQTLKLDLFTSFIGTVIVAFLAKLAYTHYLTPLVRNKERAYQLYLTRELEQATAEYEQKTQLRLISVVNTDPAETKESTPETKETAPANTGTYKYVYVPAQQIAANPNPPKDLSAPLETPTARKPERRDAAAVESKEMPVAREKEELVPDEITFSNGMVYRPDNKDFHLIQDGTSKRWGYLAEDKLGRCTKEELASFKKTLANGRFVGKNERGVGVKETPKDTYAYDKDSKKYIPSNTKLKSGATGARVFAGTFFATKVIIKGQEISNPEQYSLEYYAHYQSAKKAHRF